jgi:CheY-like chemotaxis protein
MREATTPAPIGDRGFSLPIGARSGAIIESMAKAVLVIDDDEVFRGLARRMLSDCGLTVAGEAGGIADGRSAAAKLRPDAVLLDIMLPDGDGVALARELSALPWAPRVLLTSSSADSAGEAEVGRSGAVAFIPKAELPGAPLDRLLGGE